MHTDSDLVRLTSKHQATVPRRVRKLLGLKGGDTVRFCIKGKEVVLEKAAAFDRGYLASLDAVLTEWHSPEDDDLC